MNELRTLAIDVSAELWGLSPVVPKADSARKQALNLALKELRIYSSTFYALKYTTHDTADEF